MSRRSATASATSPTRGTSTTVSKWSASRSVRSQTKPGVAPRRRAGKVQATTRRRGCERPSARPATAAAAPLAAAGAAGDRAGAGRAGDHRPGPAVGRGAHRFRPPPAVHRRDARLLPLQPRQVRAGQRLAGGRPDRARPRLPGPPADVGGGAGRLDGRRGRDRRAGGGRHPAVRGAGGAAPLLVGAAGPAGGRGGAVAAGAQPDHRLAAAARAPGTAPGPGVAGGHAARGRLGPAGLARLRPPGLAAGPRARGPPSGAVPPGRRRVRRRLVRWLPDRLRPGRRRRPRAGAGVPAEALRPDRHGVGDRAGLAAAVHRRRPRLGRRRAGRGAAPPAPPARAGARGWHLCEGGPQVTPATPRPQPPWRQVLAVGVAGLLAGAVLLGLQFVRLDRNHLGGGPSAPFFVGTAWHLDEELTARNIHVVIRQGKGYDGQWFLGLAYDPLLRGHLADGFDMPRYRARRCWPSSCWRSGSAARRARDCWPPPACRAGGGWGSRSCPGWWSG